MLASNHATLFAVEPNPNHPEEVLEERAQVFVAINTVFEAILAKNWTKSIDVLVNKF